MSATILQLWNTLSNSGIPSDGSLSERKQKRLKFFNQLLIIGFFATPFQVGMTWPLIGWKSLLFVGVSVAAGISILLNYKQQFKISKLFFSFAIYIIGVVTTYLLGGAGLYHFGVFITFFASIVLFDYKKEAVEILLGLPFVVLVMAMGEYGFLNPPDYSANDWIGVARFANIFTLLFVISILIVFVLSLNDKSETALEKSKANLESQVQERTIALMSQKEILIRQNEEKEVLLKEVHHRVKNNLQIIVSLINLQLSKTENEIEYAGLKETQNRVLSMSLVHKDMYQSSNFVEIGLHDYIQQLIDNLSGFYPDHKFQFELEVDENVSFDVETGIPLGLILNEIISNFFKYVKLQDEEPSFKISLTRMNDQTVLLKYEDNGNGFGEVENKEITTLGLELIDSLSEQVNAEFKYYSNPGAIYELRIAQDL